MIGRFLESWPLFHNAYLGGWLIGVLLATLGVLVVARDQIFIGAAISQASPSTTSASMTAKGPIATPAPSFASAATTAAG